MRDLGYVESRDFTLEIRFAEGQVERSPELAAELVRLPVDLIVAAGTAQAQAAKDATSTVPIVLVRSEDTVRFGLVASLARPGGNVTGLTLITTQLNASGSSCSRRPCPGSLASPSSGTQPSPSGPPSSRRWRPPPAHSVSK